MIGLQISKNLAAHGFTVLVGSRNFEKEKKAAISFGADARAIHLDVTGFFVKHLLYASSTYLVVQDR
ncbi:hypothetical protein ACQKL5_13880 [Peribacillus sp. NPDC097675]|uniref:hypothetical protein n=1 Tax=Peribacillus sp. NPDC097675 TaxID=3390618 RepID=UPI003CFFF3F1